MVYRKLKITIAAIVAVTALALTGCAAKDNTVEVSPDVAVEADVEVAAVSTQKNPALKIEPDIEQGDSSSSWIVNFGGPVAGGGTMLTLLVPLLLRSRSQRRALDIDNMNFKYALRCVVEAVEAVSKNGHDEAGSQIKKLVRDHRHHDRAIGNLIHGAVRAIGG